MLPVLDLDSARAAVAQRRLGDERKPARLVVAVAGEQANALALALNDQAVAVVLDFVDPFRAMGNRRGAGRQAGLKMFLRMRRHRRGSGK